ncbi:putative Late embryogenesis abundant protein [Cocos nucifera]|uniref:Putative Late embryogenesis abundant protein n=1 Tax=Cocos nucifera TaxID=13894 RepID=A0A8K0HY13_COCNU|nr:putative Late embryogenesis abundant protein [Cocos nucifera]
MSADREHITPLATATATATADRPTSDEEDATTTTTRPRSSRLRRRRCLICCGSCTALVAVIAIVLVIVTLTVYKVKEPVMTMNSVTIKNLKIQTGSSLTSPVAVNMTLVADVSVKNPNAVSFRFGRSTTTVFYQEGEMGVAYGPPGMAGAHKTFRLNVTVDVMADRLLSDTNLIGDLAAGKLDLSTSTRVGGRVKIFLIIKHHVDVTMNCSLTVAVSNMSILGQSCTQRARL